MAVRFDAASDRKRYAGSGLPDPATAFSLTGWVYLSVDQNAWTTFARLSANGSTTASMAFSSNGTGGPAYATAGGSVQIGSETPVQTWVRVGCSVAANTCTMYRHAVGDSLVTATGAVSGVAAPNEICLGGRGNADDTEWLNGRLYQVRIWSTALSQAQIQAEWDAASPVVTSGLVASWPLSSADDLTDQSGNGRHLVDISTGATAVTTEPGPGDSPRAMLRRDLTGRPPRGLRRRWFPQF
jgi:hypothetical protein